MNKVLEYFKGDELAASTWLNKYAAKGEETPNDTHKRIAKEFARIENKYNWELAQEKKLKLSNFGYERPQLDEEAIFELFKDFKYIIPGGSVLSGCGTDDLVSLSNCFVIGSPQDSYAEIMKTRNQQVQLMKRRGGVGYDLSELRPRGAAVNNAAKSSTGAASFMDVNSDLTNETAQNGRRGALMLSININHPDVEEFITKKQDLTKVTGANISVKVTDEFMTAVENDTDYILSFPVNIPQEDFLGNYEDYEYNVIKQVYTNGNILAYAKKVRARELWSTLMKCAWNTAEPGILFETAMHNYSPDGVYRLFRMISTNPCGEIPMGPFDSCRLIHINLLSFIDNPFTHKARINEEKLYEVAYLGMRLADDLVDLEIEAIDRIIEAVRNDEDFTEFNLWSRIKEATTQGRRAGLGFTGLADAIAMLGLKYDSEKGLIAVNQIMKIMFLGQLDSTIDMAIERGHFPAFDSSLEYLDSDLVGGNDWYSWLMEEFPERARKMCLYGRRNISWSTVAPTGTVSILAGCSSGIEPVFMPFYQRRRKCMSPEDRVDFTDKMGINYSTFIVVHPKLKEWAEIHYNENVDNWGLDMWEKIYLESPYYESTASEIDWRQRVKLQGIVQKYITHSISSTINLPKETTQEEIADIYLEAWRAGNKGQTIYRDGCRDGVLSAISKEKPKTLEGRDAPKRPKDLEADYYQVRVKGEQFIVLVGLFDGKPYEIFTFRPNKSVNIDSHKGIITKVRKGKYSFNSQHINISDLQLANENIEETAATLYSSMLLRHGVDINYIVKTAKKVNENITSFSSAMCRILSKYIKDGETGEVCPECQGKIVREGGCKICQDCGYSACG